MIEREWLYRIYDPDPGSRGGAIALEGDANEWNRQQWGIFRPVNLFKSAERKNSNLLRIRAWAVDLDQSSKEDQIERIRTAPLVPSAVVETKAGHHVYFGARGAKAEHWKAIVADRLVPYFDADPNARDIARLLRAPGFTHWKDPANPFLVQTVYSWPVTYTEAQIAAAFPVPKSVLDLERAHKTQASRAKRSVRASDGFWERVYNLDCLEGLTRLSGHWSVNGEVFEFREVSRGNHNIIVNGKQCEAWIDSTGRIGSRAGGGPTMWSWLAWYGHSNKDIYQIIGEVFPELMGGA